MSNVPTTAARNYILDIGLKSRSIEVGSHSIFVMRRIIATFNTVKAITKSVPSSLSLLPSPEQAVDFSFYQVAVSGYHDNFSTSSPSNLWVTLPTFQGKDSLWKHLLSVPSLLLLIQPTCLVLFNVDIISWPRVNESFQLTICKSALLYMFESVLPIDRLQALNNVYQAKSLCVVLISKNQVEECFTVELSSTFVSQVQDATSVPHAGMF